MSALPSSSKLDLGIPFTRAQARAADISVKSLLSRKFHKVGWDLYVAATTPITTRLRAAALLRLAPSGAYISHHTAAELWGAVAPASSAVHLTVATTGARLTRRGVTSHVRIVPSDVRTVDGVRVSAPAQVFIELAAAGVGLVDLVVLGDSLVKAGRVTPAELVAAASGTDPGCRAARRAAGYVRAGVDSPMESRLRMLLVLAGLPEPQVNYLVRFPNGEWRRRYDLCYPELRLLVEYDGRQHAEDTRQWQSDIHRREELDTIGWRIIVVVAEGIFVEPLRTLERVRDALRARGVKGLRRNFNPEWKLYFPGR